MKRRAKPIPPSGSEPTDPDKKRLEQFKQFEERATERRSGYQEKILERKGVRHAEEKARTERQQENVLKEEQHKKEEQRLFEIWKKQKEEEQRSIEETKRRKKEEEEHLKKVAEEEESRQKHQKEYMKQLENKAVLKHRQELLKERAAREERAKKTADEHFNRALREVEHDQHTALDTIARETREIEANAKGDVSLARQRLMTETRSEKLEVERKRKIEESKTKHGIGGISMKTGLQQLERETLQKITAIDKRFIDRKKVLDQEEQSRMREIEKEYEEKKAASLQQAKESRRNAQNQHDQAVAEAERHTNDEEAADTRQEKRHKMDSKFSGKEPGE